MPDSPLLDQIAAEQPVRDANGRFRPGVTEGKPKRGISALTKAMRLKALETLEGDRSPLIFAAKVMHDPDIPVEIRLRAAELLSRHLIPSKIEASVETSIDEIDTERLERVRAIISGVAQQIIVEAAPHA